MCFDGVSKSQRNGCVIRLLISTECFEFLRETGLFVQHIHLFICAQKTLSNFFSAIPVGLMKDIIATHKACPTYVLKIIEATAKYQFVISRSQRLTLG